MLGNTDSGEADFISALNRMMWEIQTRLQGNLALLMELRELYKMLKRQQEGNKTDAFR